MANLLVAQLLYLDSIDQKKDITMYINSPGGSVTAGSQGTMQSCIPSQGVDLRKLPSCCLANFTHAGMAVFDTMRHIRPDVSTCCIGLAASMGAFILTSGQQVGFRGRGRAHVCSRVHTDHGLSHQLMPPPVVVVISHMFISC